MLRNDTLDFIQGGLNLKYYPERVWFEKNVFNFISNESLNSYKIQKRVLNLFFFRLLHSNVSVTLGSIAYIGVSIEQNIFENST